MSEFIEYKNVKEGVYEIIFNRPEVLNAINQDMIDRIVSILDELEENDECRVLVFRGKGRSFTVGADTDAAATLDKEDYDRFMNSFRDMLTKISQFPSPVIAMVDGFAFGGGAEFSLSCDVRFGTKNAKYRFPGVPYGIVLSASTLSTIVPLPKAKELLFSAEIIDATEAYRLGILNQLIEVDELETYVYDYIDKVLAHSREPVKKAKETLNLLVGESKENRLALENKANDYLFEHTNQRETFTAFSEKRHTNRDW